ncbi:MAG: phosphoheptose isomerase [Chitinophagales bacterium]|nr:phosphoheptose isomerase [Chitinophagales bacterium]
MENITLRSVIDDSGNSVSPVMEPGTKNFLIDIDGTITYDIPNEEPARMVSCQPYADALLTINRWYEEGHIIYFFSSRTESLRGITETWLKKHGFKYHGILLGKPRGGNYHWIDNHIVRATRFIGKFGDLVKKQHEIEVFEK